MDASYGASGAGGAGEAMSEPCPTCHGRGFLPPVKVCANETCDVTFRWQEGGGTKAWYRTAGVKFCSLRCAKTQNQRERR